jgi:hypothetical protein
VPETTTKFKLIDDAAGKAAVIWLLGEFGELVESGPCVAVIAAFAYSSSDS